jgi:hypothetical protein
LSQLGECVPSGVEVSVASSPRPCPKAKKEPDNLQAAALGIDGPKAFSDI